MSDGPYRTLALRQQWRQLLKRAYETAFDSQDVVDAISPALERDCAWEFSKEFMPLLRAYCGGNEPSLPFEAKNHQLERLKHLSAGRGTLAHTVADCAAEALAQGKNGESAVEQALRQGLTDRLVRNARAMEEHVLRESGSRKAADVRSCLATAISRAGVDALARKLMSQAASANAAPTKHTGLDDGVGLR